VLCIIIIFIIGVNCEPIKVMLHRKEILDKE